MDLNLLQGIRACDSFEPETKPKPLQTEPINSIENIKTRKEVQQDVLQQFAVPTRIGATVIFILLILRIILGD